MFNVLNLIGPFFGAIIPGRGTVYLLLGALVFGFGGGVYVTKKFWDASEVTAVNEARVKEQDAVLLGDGHSKGVLDRARQRKGENDAIRNDLERRLASAPACTVPVPRQRVRNPGMPPASPDPGRARSANPRLDPVPDPADPGPVADARDVVRTCELNRTDAYQPEADERQALRDWYNDLRKRFNR